MQPLLVVEDDPVLGRGLVINLELEGYKVTWLTDLKSAMSRDVAQEFGLVLLDLGLPDGNGLDLCVKLRENGSAVPVIMLTAQTDEDSVVRGLQAGANDYVRKPFGNRELLARIRSILREPVLTGPRTRYADLVIMPEQRKAFAGDREIEVNRREFDILRYLVEHAEGVVTREALLSSLNRGDEIFDRTVDSHISHLRAKLRNKSVESVQIVSIYGVGYRLEKR